MDAVTKQKLVSPLPTFYHGCCNKTKTGQSISFILSGMLQQNKNWSVNVLYFIRDAETKQKLVSQFPKFNKGCWNKTKNWSVNSLHFISDAAIKTGQSIPYILSGMLQPKLFSPFRSFIPEAATKQKNWSSNFLHFITDAAIKTGQSIPYILSRTAIKTG